MPATGSVSVSVGVGRAPLFATASSTRVTSPACTRLGLIVRRTRMRSFVAPTSTSETRGSASNATPTTKSSTTENVRAAMSTPRPATSIPQPARVSTGQRPFGTGTMAMISSSTLPGVMPCSWASGAISKRCARTGSAIAFTSSGVA